MTDTFNGLQFWIVVEITVLKGATSHCNIGSLGPHVVALPLTVHQVLVVVITTTFADNHPSLRPLLYRVTLQQRNAGLNQILPQNLQY